MAQTETFYWHDYETFGIDPRRDWPSQFAGIRTDMDFNIIGEPQMFYCKPPQDCLPHPEACLLTRVSPMMALKEGLLERDFIAKILNEMTQANTCVLGYNSIRFDDEVTRHLLYRNFHDPYQREYQNGCSRWDLIDLVRTCHALRPEGIEWPKNEDGTTSFRLELLTAINGISHEGAHDALSDVYATIAFAKLLKNKQQRLFEFLFDLRKKEKAATLVQQSFHDPVIHVSSKFPASQHCLALVKAICPDPKNKNATILCDLTKDISYLLDTNADDIREALYTKRADLPEGTQRPPIKGVQVNKCPALAPTSVLREKDIERLELDMALIESNSDFVQRHQSELSKKITEVYKENTFPQSNDPDLQLYGGGFFSWNDKKHMQKLTTMQASELTEAQHNLNFEDTRLPEMLFRYRARNFPESLEQEEKKIWYDFCQCKFNGQAETTSINLQDYRNKISQLSQENEHNEQASSLLKDLLLYADQVTSE